MRFVLIAASVFCVLSSVMAANVFAEDILAWTALSELPASLGVAGPFAGISHDTLIVAGGANFPNGAPWHGGEKVWQDDLYILDRAEGQWRFVGALKAPELFGNSAGYPDGEAANPGFLAESLPRFRAGG